jgi:hypothetical protein
MKTDKKQIHKFLVLVPHRDIRVELQKDCDLALKEGLTGVYNFPLVAPFASLSRSLNTYELKKIAHSLRKTTGKNKITAEDDAVTVLPCSEKRLTLCGPRLDINFPQDLFESVGKKINVLFSPLVIGCFLTPELSPVFRKENKKLEFRAGAVANMYWRPLQIDGEIYYKWKIGKLCWLPRP